MGKTSLSAVKVKPGELSPAGYPSKHSDVLVYLYSHLSLPRDGTGRAGQPVSDPSCTNSSGQAHAGSTWDENTFMIVLLF